MKYSLTVLFWLNKSKINNKGKAPIYARITVNGKRSELATGERVEPEKWNAKAGSVRGNKEEARRINALLDQVRAKVRKIFNKLLEEKSVVASSMVKNAFIGKKHKEYSLLQIFRQHNDDMRAQVGKEYAAGTLERYEASLKLTQEFLKHKYKRSDIFLSELQYSFITDYEFFLKTVRGNSHNTASKYLRNFKKIVRIAVVNGWLARDPFVGYKCTGLRSSVSFLPHFSKYLESRTLCLRSET